MKIIAILLTISGLWSILAEARSCRDEPERCPVTRWVCTQPVPANLTNYSYLQAVVTNSMFTGDTMTVTENFCRGVPLTCREQKRHDQWYFYPQVPQGRLVSKANGQQIILNCTEYNRN